MADGSLNFDTKIDNSGFNKDANTLRGKLNSLKNAFNSIGLAVGKAFGGQNSAVIKLNGQIKQTEAQIQQLRTEMEQMANTPFESKIAAGISKDVEKAEQKLLSLLNQREALEESMRAEVAGMPNVSPEATQSGIEASSAWQKLTAQIDATERKLSEYETKLRQTKAEDAKVDPTQTNAYETKKIKLEALIAKLNTYKAKLNEVNSTESKVPKTTNKAAASIKRMNNAVNPACKNIMRLGNMFKLMLLRMAMRGVIEGVKQGFTNFAKYSSEVNRNLTILKSGLIQLQNSLAAAFSPILSAITPALQTLINYLVTAINVIGQFFAALFGGSKTVTQAKQVTSDFAGGVSDAGAAAKKAAKDVKKALGPFDELNQLQINTSDTDSGSGGSGGAGGLDAKDMFEEVEINPKILEFIEKLKEALGPTIEALERLKTTLGPFKDFAFQAALDFYNNFLVPVGNWVLGEDGLPRLINLIAETFENINWTKLNQSLAAFFTELAKAAIFVGTAVIDFYEFALKPIAEWTMNEGLPAFIDAITNGLSKIDWEKIRTALINLWDSIAPFAIQVGEGLLWFLDNVLVPLAVWTISDLLPVFLDLLAVAVDTLSAILDAFKPLGKWLFDKFLKPIAKWTGGAIVSIIEGLTDVLEGISDWISNHQSLIENGAIIVGSFFAAFKLTSLASGIAPLLASLPGLIGSVIGVFGSVLGAISPITIAIGAVIAIGILLYKNWDTVKAYAETIWNAITGVFSAAVTAIKGAFTGIGQWFCDRWDDICNAFSEVCAWFGNKFDEAYKAVTGVFESIGKWFGERWTDICNVFKDIKNWFTKKFTEAVDGVKAGFQAAKTKISEIYTAIQDLFKSIKEWFTTKFNEAVEGVKAGFAAATTKVSEIFTAIKALFDKIKETFKTFFENAVEGVHDGFEAAEAKVKAIYKKIKDVFKNIKGAFKKIFDKAVDGIKSAFTGIIDWFGDLWSKIKNVFSGGIDVPVSTSGSTTSSTTVSTSSAGISPMSISTASLDVPYLATGAVIPPNKKFLAVLGDQKSGTNVEAPLQTIVDAVKIAMNGMGSSKGNQTVVLELNGREFGRAVVECGDQERSRVGVRLVTG